MVLSEKEMYRIIDANLNRAREGLRVIEEFARFVLNDTALQNRTKSLRHKVASLFPSLPLKKRIDRPAPRHVRPVDRQMLIDLGRNARSDVGKHFFPAPAAKRETAADLLHANFARVEESVRVLEEFAKLFPARPVAHIQALRFEVYTLEKEYLQATNRASNVRSLKSIGLYPIIDRETVGHLDLLAVARQILLSGVRIFQYRDKTSPTSQLCDICTELQNLARRKRVIFIVNDRVDVAQAIDADGVHLGQKDMPVVLARRLLGSRKIIGKSTHSLTQARQAAKEDVDYIAVGPIFSTPTRPAGRPVGTELLAKVRKITGKAVIAIGGINRHNLIKVLDTGADGAAVISAVLKAKSIRSAALSLSNLCRKKLKNRT